MASAALGGPGETTTPHEEEYVPHLGLGGRSLPKLLGESCTVIEMDGDSVDLAEECCGLDPELGLHRQGG